MQNGTLAKPPASAEESGCACAVAAAVCVDALGPQVPHLHFLPLRSHWLVPCIQGSKRMHSEVVLGSLQTTIQAAPQDKVIYKSSGRRQSRQ